VASEDALPESLGSRARERAFEALVTRYGPDVVNYIRRRRHPIPDADVHDVAEEVFIVVWRRFDDVPPGAELPWMLSITRNVVFNAKRSFRRRGNYESAVRPVGDSASAEESFLATDSVRQALSALRTADREILTLHYWDGLEIPELATALSLSTHAASVRLSRAAQRFQEILAESKEL
jgi:RNA polymerase sigma-70 factor (ECF subfamily)